MRVISIEPIKAKEKVKKKVCAYVRVSTFTSSQGESFENQSSYYERILSENTEYEFIGIFADRGLTGTKANREEFVKMLELARNGGIDVIFTKSISRFARNTVDLLEIVREMKLIGVEIRFEEEGINTLSGDGELMLAVLSSFAQEESKSVSENIKWMFKKKFEQGELLLNAKRFLGYDFDEYGDLVINLKEAKVVEYIFEEYLSGKGVFTIAKELNSKGVKTVTGGKWYENTVLYILKNEKYKGDALLQKTYTTDHLTKTRKMNRGQIDSFYVVDSHPAIIIKEVWEQVQVEMKKRAEAKGNYKGNVKSQNRYPLSGMLYCSKCGATLRRCTWSSKLTSKKIVWQCSNYIINGKDACSGTVIEDEVISRIDIKEPTIVKEEVIDGKKHYSYTSKSQ